MARYTADSTVRPFRKMWKFFFDDKDSVGVRITTRHQRTWADIQAEADIATHDIFTLIEGHMITRKQDLIFREDFIAEMMSEATTQQTKNKTAFRLASAVKRQQALQVAESRAYGSGLYHKPGWVTSQFHDPLRVKAATKATWVDDIIGNLDIEKTRRNIRLSDPDFETVIQTRETIVAKIKALGYRFVTLDLTSDSAEPSGLESQSG